MISWTLRLILLALPFALIAGCFAALMTVYRMHLWNNVYRELSKKYRGQFTRRWWLPQLSMAYRDQRCHVANFFCLIRRFERTTRVDLSWPLNHECVEVATPGYGTRLILSPRVQSIGATDPELSSHWLIRSPSAQAAQQLLTRGVCEALQGLRRSTPDPGLNALIGNRRLSVTVGRFLTRQADLEELLRRVWHLHDQLQLALQEGLAFASEGEIQLEDDAVCPICGQGLQMQRAVCARCRTPHCRDCWEYNGSCATFACGEKQFLEVDARLVKLNS